MNRALVGQLGRKAFTLIELLVVITIIGILVSITLPTISKVKETAKRVKCLTNLKGFGVAFELYRTANKDLLPYVLPFHNSQFPPNPNDPSLLTVLEGYMDATPPYYDENGVLVVTEPYICPSDTDGVGRETGFSYEYWPGALMIAREIFRADPRPAPTVTKFYEHHLKDVDIGIAQLSLLIRLYYLPDVPVTKLARVMKTDRTTLTRNLQPLERSGHLEIVSADDKRSRLVRLSAKGFASVAAALPAWQLAQRQMEEKLGTERWTRLMEDLRLLAHLDDG